MNIFAERRPPGIYKPDYIQALYDFYHEVPENMVCPSTPEWKRSSDLDLNGEAAQDDDDVGDRSTLSHVIFFFSIQIACTHFICFTKITVNRFFIIQGVQRPLLFRKD